MDLSYLLRLLCLVVVVVGAVHALGQLALAACSRPILRLLAAATARGRERALYLLQAAPLCAAFLFAGALCVPEYLRLEPANSAEAVSPLCLALAAAVVLWFGASALRGARLCLRTVRFTRACERCAHPLESAAELPLLALPQTGPLIALAGFFRPTLLVSRDLLAGRMLDPAALAVAFDHERSHAAHRDNWKLLSLRLLPGLGWNPWLAEWKSAAEWAADDDAARGDAARRLLLAETLLRVARCAPAAALPILHTGFSCREQELAARIDRLLREPAPCNAARRSLLVAAAALVLALAAAAVILWPSVYALSESILHLG